MNPGNEKARFSTPDFHVMDITPAGDPDCRPCPAFFLISMHDGSLACRLPGGFLVLTAAAFATRSDHETQVQDHGRQ
jgi:hypothetical protein